MADRRDDDRLLGWIAAAAASLFTGTIVVVILVQLFGPSLGLKVGAVSDAAIGTLVAAVLTLTGALGARDILRRWRNGNGP
jgi:hypothetical protein